MQRILEICCFAWVTIERMTSVSRGKFWNKFPLHGVKAGMPRPPSDSRIFSAAVVLLICSCAYAQESAVQLFHKMQQALGVVQTKSPPFAILEEIVSAEAFSNAGQSLG